MKLRIVCVAAGFLSLVLALTPFAVAQTSTQTASALPRLVRFTGTVKDLNGNPLTGVVGVTFSLYSEQTGGAALWLETQNVTADSTGHYVVLLGATKPEGLPTDLFTSEQARWVGVQVSGQAEQPRVLLVSAPYALKAGDAETIGGLPPSAFVLAAPAIAAASGSAAASTAESVSPATTSDVTTTGGTVDAIPLFSAATNIQNSILTQTGTTVINVGGKLNLPATGAATATAGVDSHPLDFVASSFSSTTSTAINQTFQWQAEPAANDTAAPSGTLNLLYGLGATAPSETGLKLSNKGLFTFATGQTFPGTGTITGITTATGSGLTGGGTTGTLSLSVPAAGITNTMLKDSTITLNASAAGGLTVPGAMTLGDTYTIGLKACTANQVLEYVGTAWACTTPAAGTITGITTASGSGLSGGGTTGTLSLSVPAAGITNAMLQHSSLTVAAGTGLTGGGAVSLGGSSTALSLASNTCASGNALSALPFTCSPFAALGANTFTANQTINANLLLPNTNTAGTQGVIEFAGVPFIHNWGPSNSYNAFVGRLAGNFTTSGAALTAVGDFALPLNTTGSGNTAIGNSAMGDNNTGSDNTAVGFDALYGNTSGSNNTALGYLTGPYSAKLSNTTAIGSNSNVNESNALVLGQTTPTTPGSTWVNVGIGTAVPGSTLEAYVTNTNGLGPTLTLTNGGIGTNVSSSLDFNTYPPLYGSTYNPTARILATDDGSYSSNLIFYSNVPDGQNNTLQANMTISSNGQVVIGAASDFHDQFGVYQIAESGDVGDAIGGWGFSAPSGSGLYAGAGITGTGGSGDGSNSSSVGGVGGQFYGGTGGGYSGDGIFAEAISQVINPGLDGYAGYFNGPLWVNGAAFANAIHLKIDNPLDPSNRYLLHSSVESSEMMNIYTGNVTTDAQGDARVALPDWFEALNTDFRYQLTVIGQFAQAIVSSEVANHQFSIKTDKPNVKVSWQITGVRQDAYAKAHPLVVDEQKDARERGHYIHPELYGASEQQSVAWARHPETARWMQAKRAQQAAESQKQKTTARAETLPLAVPPGLKDTRPLALPAQTSRPSPAQKPSPRN
jgi:trimeric autotransporter adhesin